MARTSGFARGLASGGFAILLVGFLALAVAVGVVPKVMNGAALTVLTGSMEPTYEPGDIVVSVPQDQYRIGDPVTFQPRSNVPMLITHRVVAVTDSADGRTYVTRGDANGDDDEPIVEAQVMGKVLYSIPKLGYVQQAVGGNKGLLVAGIGFVLIAYAAYALVSGAIERRGEKKTAAQTPPTRPEAATAADAGPSTIENSRTPETEKTT
ncbi:MULTISPECIES: signal peptidase I [unclassified Brevibacterium]|uniref:signal peptidase I n=1 Tax=unclassified Brevibacterium TaxID=2614124 RepID=UPI0010F8D0E1|nr:MULTISPECIES: signal peptidase I [unclassified Brevibacterium]MCM1012076.1 signal peptidase I [Brevibacterium sp. XM4083]